jgi:hypothetical protein
MRSFSVQHPAGSFEALPLTTPNCPFPYYAPDLIL